MGRPISYAAVLATAYLVVAGTYIAVSGEIAAAVTASLEDLRDVELVKGLAFVGITGTLLFALALALFRRLARAEVELARGREALLVADRQAIPGLLAASIAHDFNNVLTVVLAGVQEVREAVTSERSREIVDDVVEAAKRGSDLARRLSRAGQGSATGDAKRADLATTVGEAVDLLRLHPKARRREILLDARGPLEVLTYSVLVHQIVTNLVVNALDALPDGGKVLVRVERANGVVCIEVHDSGAGVPPLERGKLFEPFYTTKAEGTGLGLLSVRTCARMHNGEVEVDDSAELGGACFRVRLREPDRHAGA